jgi:myo-inositol-1(or 4)-monophosphatase
MNEFLEACCEAARIGGHELEKWRSKFSLRFKGRNDLVTDADLASQTAIHDYLRGRFPDHNFLGEEQLDLPMTQNSESPWRWIVDPLDGTLNYVHQLQSWSTSVALWNGNRIVAAAVFDPWLNELYSAGESTPATLNGVPLRVSECKSIDNALLVVSLPSRVHATSPELQHVTRLICNSRSVRRLGSAALNLCYVAAGRVDGYWATCLNLWDIAAGWLIVEKAGGVMISPDGQPVDPHNPQMLAAACPALADQMRKIALEGP